MRCQPLICVTDVEASSRWYQRLLRCRSAHGGRQYEQLVKDGWRAAEMGVEIVLPRHRNPPDEGGPNHWECWMRDPDGYTVVVASPYGTADGAWRPGPDLFT